MFSSRSSRSLRLPKVQPPQAPQTTNAWATRFSKPTTRTALSASACSSSLSTSRQSTSSSKKLPFLLLLSSLSDHLSKEASRPQITKTCKAHSQCLKSQLTSLRPLCSANRASSLLTLTSSGRNQRTFRTEMESTYTLTGPATSLTTPCTAKSSRES